MGNSTWFNLLLLTQVIAGLGVIGLVLMQHGKGADMGAAFGSGASGSLFGASGSANFLSRTTAVLAMVFFVASLGLSYLASYREAAPASIMEGVGAPATEEKTAAPAADDSVPAVPVAGTTKSAAEEGAQSSGGAIPE